MVSRITRTVRKLFTRQILVATYLGQTGTGPSFADPEPVMALVAHKVRVVRDRQGAEVVSSAQVFCDPAHESQFAPQSRVTLPGARTADVIDVAVHADHRGRGTVLEAALT